MANEGMRISDYGLRFIAGWEGIRLRLYDDGGAGKGNCTVGVGHLVHLGPCDGRIDEAPFRNGITEQQAIDLFRFDVPRYEDVVKRYSLAPLNQNQFDALVDFCFNTGGGYPGVWSAVNGGGDVCAVLLRTAITPAWATAALLRRRAAECELYRSQEQHGSSPEEDEMWVRRNGIDPFFENRDLGEGPPGTLQCAGAFQLPPEAVAVDLEVFIDPSSAARLVLLHGDGAYAGQAGAPWGFRSVIRCQLQNGTAQFRVEGGNGRPCRTQRIGILGYLTG